MQELDALKDDIVTISDKLKTETNDSYLEREHCKHCELLRKRSGMSNVVCHDHGSKKPSRTQIKLFDQVVSSMKIDMMLKGN